MRLVPLSSSVVCLAPLGPGAIGVDEFAEGLELGPPAVLVANPQLQVAQYARLQLTVVPGRAQLEFPAGATEALILEAARRLLAAVAAFRPTGIGFNASVRMEREGDEDPVATVMNAADAARRLDGDQAARGGMKVLYQDDSSRWTWSVDPLADEDDAWIGLVNRHFIAMPPEGLDAVLLWFSTSEEDLQARMRALTGIGAADE
jgi:hypothetical protein